MTTRPKKRATAGERIRTERVYTIKWSDGTVRATVDRRIVRAAMQKLGGEVEVIHCEHRTLAASRKRRKRT